MPGTLPESQVVKIWQAVLPGRTDLVTEDGEAIEIVYPGRLNDDRGADLRDAVIATGRGLLKGDVEVHIRSGGWWAHHHHQDPAYNRVIMHVVVWHDTETAINLENGHKVPTLALHRFMTNGNGSVDISPRRPAYCRRSILPGDSRQTGMVLDVAGDERFLARAAGLQATLARGDAGQCLYEGIMEALGYSKNKQSMAELARRVPLRRIETAATKTATATEYLARCQGQLLGTAGLLPSQRAGPYRADNTYDEWVDKLERVWAACGGKTAMTEDDWHLFKVRPGNFPVRRIAAMSHLLLRYRRQGMLTGMLDRLGQTGMDAFYQEPWSWLLVPSDGYWAKNLDFGRPGGTGLPALLGRGRAADIVVNVLLPFATAWSKVNSCPEITDKAIEIYRNHPPLAENTLERHMRRQLGISRYLLDTARRQQGLIHIYRTFCAQGGCERCPAGGSGE